MKIIKKMRKAKGFTLVELLIVIIIIGILAGMMMLATGAATDKAEATKIVSNMRNIKAAAIMCYADYGKFPADGTTVEGSSLDQYMDNSPKGYTIELISTKYYVETDGTATEPVIDGTGIVDKLKEMTTNSGIIMSGDTLPVRMQIN